MTSTVPSERFRAELEEALAGAERDDDPIETIARLGARLIIQQALEGEVELFLGRARYERGEELVGYRNGYEPRTVKTTSGPLKLERPRLRNASELGFASRIVGEGVTRTHALEAGRARLPARTVRARRRGVARGDVRRERRLEVDREPNLRADA
jgi:putative transposase